jgi:hypothetical protein
VQEINISILTRNPNGFSYKYVLNEQSKKVEFLFKWNKAIMEVFRFLYLKKIRIYVNDKEFACELFKCNEEQLKVKENSRILYYYF